MSDYLSEEQCKIILQSLDEALNQETWEKSNYLRAIKTNLQTVRDKFAHEMGASPSVFSKEVSVDTQTLDSHVGQQEIFVSLYSYDGSNLQFWEKIVANLPKQMISRPIYAQEEQIKAIIKLKENKLNEAYASIFINPADIISLHPDKVLSDKLGQPLLALKDKTLNLDNVDRFVHLSGVYKYVNGHLIKTS